MTEVPPLRRRSGPSDKHHDGVQRGPAGAKQEDFSSGDDPSETRAATRRHRRRSSSSKRKVTRRSSREEYLSSDSSPEVPSNEARKSAFAALKKKGVDYREAVAKKLLSDPKKFDRLMQRWRDADVDGYGFLDKETFIEVMVIQLRSRQRPLPEETEWLCNALRTKNRMIAYREARNVLVGDYFSGSTYMPMWATGAFPATPGPFAQTAMATAPLPYGMPPGVMLPFPTAATATMGFNPMLYTAAQHHARTVSRADSLQPSMTIKKPSSASADARASDAKTKTMAFTTRGQKGRDVEIAASKAPKAFKLSLPLEGVRDDGKARDQRFAPRGKGKERHERTKDASSSQDEGPKRSRGRGRNGHGGKGRQVLSSPESRYAEPSPRTRRREAAFTTRSWPDSDDDSEASEQWASLPGSVGEWLRYVASPLERRNFEELMRILDELMYDRGCNSRDQEGAPNDGVLLRLGPMLHAKLTFHISS